MTRRRTSTDAAAESLRPPTPPDWPTTPLAAVIFLLLALIFFLPAFLPGRHIFGTDYLAGGYFFYDFVSSRLEAGSLPKWVPYIFGGLPLFANPGSAYQPVHLLLSLLLPTPRVLPAVLAVHFFVAGLGMFLLAKELRCRSWIALVAGVAFQFTGLIVSWIYAGHDGRIIVATLTPLFFYFLRRGIRTSAVGPFFWAGTTLGLALLSFQIQNSYYLLIAAAIWSVYSLVHLDVFADGRRLARVAALGLGAVAFGFLLAAVNFLPFLDYIAQSTRGVQGGRGYEYATSFSMPPVELVSIAVPEVHGVSLADPNTGAPLFPTYTGVNGFKLHTEYVGALVLLLLAAGFYYSRRDRDWLFFLGLSAFMLTIAVGSHTPLYRLYYAVLPGTQQFRAPSLAFFIVALALVAMAALTLERIAVLRDQRLAPRAPLEAGRQLDRLPWILGGVAAIALLGAITGGEASAGWGRFLLFVGAIGGVLWPWSRGRMGGVSIGLILVALTVGDLWLIGKRFFHTVGTAEVEFAEDDVMAFLRQQPQPSRVWTFPVPQQYRSGGPYGGDYPMLHGIQQVGGEHPNPLSSWVEYLGAGTETYIDWHNLLAEIRVVDVPEGQAIAFRGHPGMLDAANVRYIVSMALLSHPDLREVHRGTALVYENTASLPRAWLVSQVEQVTPEQHLPAMTDGDWDPRQVAYASGDLPQNLPQGALQGGAEVLEYTPDRVVIRATADRPALLVLADNFYEGWRARINGSETPVFLTNHTMRGVVVPAGASEVVFTFEPADLTTGVYLSVAGLLLVVAYAGWDGIRWWRRPRLGDGGQEDPGK